MAKTARTSATALISKADQVKHGLIAEWYKLFSDSSQFQKGINIVHSLLSFLGKAWVREGKQACWKEFNSEHLGNELCAFIKVQRHEDQEGICTGNVILELIFHTAWVLEDQLMVRHQSFCECLGKLLDSVRKPADTTCLFWISVLTCVKLHLSDLWFKE